MMSLTQSSTTLREAQELISAQVKAMRLRRGYTQAGLAQRAGVSLSTLRRFEQSGHIALESLCKICLVLGCLENLVEALNSDEEHFATIDDVLADRPIGERKRGWRT